MASADTRPSQRSLAGSMTLSSSLPTCVVSPAETLRSLTMPSKGARTPVRSTCWRAGTRRERAASRSLCAEFLCTSTSSSCCIDTTPVSRSLLMRWYWRSACSNAWAAARSEACAELRLAGMGGLAERHRQIAAADRLAVLAHHGQHDDRHLGAQIRAALGLDGARDRRTG